MKNSEINNLGEELANKKSTIHTNKDINTRLQKEIYWLKNQLMGTQSLVEARKIMWGEIVTSITEI